jgi:hypothetical protein
MCGFGCNDDGVSLNGAGAVQGTQGIQGIQGIQGLRGLLGPQGATGSPGVGTEGIQGRAGIQGPEGRTGLGVQGTTGAQGTRGLQGFSGLQGAIGTQGAVGPRGIQGTQGTRGVQGLLGTQGIQGVQGVCPCGQVYYSEEKAPLPIPDAEVYTPLATFTYTVPTGGAGTYRVYFQVTVRIEPDVWGSATASIFKNATELSIYMRRQITQFYEAGTFSSNPMIEDITLIHSNITLAVGDIIDVRMIAGASLPASIVLNNGVFILDKIT